MDDMLKVDLEDDEAAVAARCILALQSVQLQAQQQAARINAKLSELEGLIRKRLPDLPQVPISEWKWDLDPVDGTGSANIPEGGE